MTPLDRPSKVPIDVCTLFEKLTLDVIAAGHTHYSADAILHRIRWHYTVDKADRSFKANNNWTPHLARWFMSNHLEFGSDFFHTRRSPRRGGPGHNMEDYMGPVDIFS